MDHRGHLRPAEEFPGRQRCTDEPQYQCQRWQPAAPISHEVPGPEDQRQRLSLTADDEPSTITDWQADNGQLSSDIAQLDSDGDGVGGPDDAAYRAKVQGDVAQFQKDFATAEKDADHVEAGK